MSTWLAMAVLALVAVVVIARPWLSSRLPRSLRRRAANVAAYRTRLAEIDAEVAADVLSTDSAEALKIEQAQRLLGAEAGVVELSAAPLPLRRRSVGLALALLPVLVAGLWYLQTGSWRTAQQVAAGNSATADATAETSRVTTMVAELQQRLQAHPGDAHGWALLGRSQMVLQNYQQSADAYAKANQLSGHSNPAWLVGEGQSLALAGGHDLQGKPAQLFTQALKIAPDDPRALWYAGLVAAQSGDKDRARKLWQTLADQNGVPADVRAALEDQIHQLDLPASSTAAATQAVQDPAGTLAAAAPVTLHLQINLAPALTAKMPKDATLYVYAKAANGPPVPLAVQRIQHPKLPLKLTLNDSMGVMPTAHLSDFDAWTVSARLSRSGNAQPQSGDLQGQITLSRAQSAALAIIDINHLLP